MKNEKLYRIWFNDTTVDQQLTFLEHEKAAFAKRFGFDPAEVKPGCDIELTDDDGDVIGGVVEY